MVQELGNGAPEGGAANGFADVIAAFAANRRLVTVGRVLGEPVSASHAFETLRRSGRSAAVASKEEGQFGSPSLAAAFGRAIFEAEMRNTIVSSLVAALAAGALLMVAPSALAQHPVKLTSALASAGAEAGMNEPGRIKSVVEPPITTPTRMGWVLILLCFLFAGVASPLIVRLGRHEA